MYQVAMFSGYCTEPFACEDIVVCKDGKEEYSPGLKPSMLSAGT